LNIHAEDNPLPAPDVEIPQIASAVHPPLGDGASVGFPQEAGFRNGA
jgi:hypothetical protein